MIISIIYRQVQPASVPSISVSSQSIKVTRRKLQTRWSCDLTSDLKSMVANVNAAKRLTRALTHHVDLSDDEKIDFEKLVFELEHRVDDCRAQKYKLIDIIDDILDHQGRNMPGEEAYKILVEAGVIEEQIFLR